MSDAPVLRFPISGEDHQFFLLQVIPTQGAKNKLDARLLGTEGTGAYEAKLRHKRATELKASSSHCTNEEWEHILVAALIDHDTTRLHGIEIKADVQSTSCTLNFRKNIQGITQRLGSIKLDEFEIVTDKNGNDNGPQLFDWCVAAIGSRTKVVDQLATVTTRAEELEKSVNELKSQLQELIKAKEDDEHQLLEKFRDLLNEKKLKIRQQQRLLASADVDPAKLENAGASQDTVRKAKASRGSKRKMTQDVSDESDDGFERMEVEEAEVEVKDEPQDDPEMDDQETTDDDLEDPATQSDVEDSDGASRPAAKPSARTTAKGKATAQYGRAKSSKSSTSNKKGGSKEAATGDEEDRPPPRRTLPFQTNPKEAHSSKPADDDETESDDDEL